MLSFHNSQNIKDKYVSRVKHHQNADNLIRGLGWEDGKGCAVGCTLENYDHSQYPVELGVPEWLAHVEDRLFEGMSLEKSKTWPEVFLKAIPLGVDLEKVKAPFLIMVLESTLEAFDQVKYPGVKKSINTVIDLYKSGETDVQKFKDVASFAADVADAARYAVRAAVDTAYDASSAAAAKKFDYFADQLVEILKNQ